MTRATISSCVGAPHWENSSDRCNTLVERSSTRMWTRRAPNRVRAARHALASCRGIHTRLETFYNPTAASLNAHFEATPSLPGAVSLYLLSTTTPRSELEPIIHALHSHLPSSVGSFTLPLTTQTAPSVVLATFTPGAGERIRTFNSELESRPAAQVGKWQRDALTAANNPGSAVAGRWTEDKKGSDVGEMERLMGGTDDGTRRDWSALWEAGRNERKGGDSLDLPEQLWGLRQDQVDSIILLTDSAPQALLNTITASFPSTSTLGFVTPPTPFVTSLPSTLFYEGALQSKGGVGIAISSPHSSFVTSVEYTGYQPLSEAFVIASAQGNLLLAIDHSNPNPTQALIRSIQARPGNASKQKGMAGLGKDEEFFMALLDPSGDVKRVVKILSGDPSRGALSLEMEEPLVAGQRVQFMHRPEAVSVCPAESDLSLITLPKDDGYESATDGASALVDGMTVRRGFVGASEGGFIYSSPTRHGEASVCMVPGAHGQLKVRDA